MRGEVIRQQADRNIILSEFSENTTTKKMPTYMEDYFHL
jgi:hypothetical protein